MPKDKRKKPQPTKKQRQPKQSERAPQRRSDDTVEPAGEPAGEPAREPQSDRPRQPEPHSPRPRPGAGLDKSDTGVIAGRRLAGKRFTG